METDTYTLPSAWVTALINGDFSGLDDTDPEEGARCRALVEELAARGITIVSDVEDSDRFTWRYQLYDGADCTGGNVMDYVAVCRGRP